MLFLAAFLSALKGEHVPLYHALQVAGLLVRQNNYVDCPRSRLEDQSHQSPIQLFLPDLRVGLQRAIV